MAVLPPPVPAAMNRCGSSSSRSAIHLPPPAQGGQVDPVRGQVVPVERGAVRRGGRVPPGGLERAEGGGQVAAECRRMSSSMWFCRAASGFQVAG